ncbi:MAG: type-F conjugative transfer system protein TraW [Candidatus Accumulibacter sp.]|uniref:Type-F conjugative transfer system protein TraW n=1 Tax=Candidatus Accumulibacter proximus TaxID=2954385 RepID=A0A935UG34_9PROT|nr:type-F conjugative transfer system protein TraW [Candidatus Accumulibacter proximus]
MSTLLPLLALLLVGWMPAVRGDELGVVGPTYEIAEPDLLAVIESRLKRMAQTGELARKQREHRDRVVSAVEKPKPVPGVQTTVTPRRFFLDPTWVLDRDIRTADGALLFARGQKVNPLEHVSLRERLVLFDGRDRRQVALARQTVQRSWGLRLMRSWKRRVFYDQGGNLTRRLGIRQVPAVVSQDGKRLRIDEIRP